MCIEVHSSLLKSWVLRHLDTINAINVNNVNFNEDTVFKLYRIVLCQLIGTVLATLF